ncbi:MAG: class I SAM-dependent methyltransferase [Dechloromonas sp.]|nr:MAG: class I SAM-dependent methyltransferase [Dechloromonas sp.]
MSDVFDGYAAYYDLLYQDKDYAAEARYILELLSENDVRSGSILELGCGTGRHAAHFDTAGFCIDGYDISARMVSAASSRSPASANVRFSVGDARTLRTGKRYDAVLALFHVASYQTTNDELRAVFMTAASHLERHGVFVFDCWYGPGVLTDPPADRVRHAENDQLSVVRKATPVVHPRENLVDVNYEINATSKLDGTRTTIIESHRMRYLFEPELHSMLDSCGLRMSAAFAYPTHLEPALDTWQAIFIARPQ